MLRFATSLRGDCCDDEEAAEDGHRRGVFEVACGGRGGGVGGVSFRAGVSGLGRDDAAGRRAVAVADCGGVGGKRGRGADGGVPEAWRFGGGRGGSASGARRSGCRVAGSGTDVSTDCGGARSGGEGADGARSARARYAAGSEVHREDHDRRSADWAEGESGRGGDCAGLWAAEDGVAKAMC